MLLSARAQTRMQGSIPAQLVDIQRELGETRTSFARRVGRHVGAQALRGLSDPYIHVKQHYADLIRSEARLYAVYVVNGVGYEYRPLAYAATLRRVMEGMN